MLNATWFVRRLARKEVSAVLFSTLRKILWRNCEQQGAPPYEAVGVGRVAGSGRRDACASARAGSQAGVQHGQGRRGTLASNKTWGWDEARITPGKKAGRCRKVTVDPAPI
jgi:hypothetical protein